MQNNNFRSPQLIDNGYCLLKFIFKKYISDKFTSTMLNYYYFVICHFSSVVILSSKWKDVCEKNINSWIISDVFNFQNASSFSNIYCYKIIISDWIVNWLKIDNPRKRKNLHLTLRYKVCTSLSVETWVYDSSVNV